MLAWWAPCGRHSNDTRRSLRKIFQYTTCFSSPISQTTTTFVLFCVDNDGQFSFLKRTGSSKVLIKITSKYPWGVVCMDFPTESLFYGCQNGYFWHTVVVALPNPSETSFGLLFLHSKHYSTQQSTKWKTQQPWLSLVSLVGHAGSRRRRRAWYLPFFKIFIFHIPHTLQHESCTMTMIRKLQNELADCNNSLRSCLLVCLDRFPFTDTKDWFDVATFRRFLEGLGVLDFDNKHLSTLLSRMGQLEKNPYNKKTYYRMHSGRNTSPKAGEEQGRWKE